jgi:hypothetical protein
MDLFQMEREKTGSALKLTVLHRPNHDWLPVEIERLKEGLQTVVSSDPEKTSFLVLFGHFTKEQALTVLGGAVEFTVAQITGVNSKELPFNPRFM